MSPECCRCWSTAQPSRPFGGAGPGSWRWGPPSTSVVPTRKGPAISPGVTLRRRPATGCSIPAPWAITSTACSGAAWALSGSRAEAEDLVQETFVRVLAGRAGSATRMTSALLQALGNTFISSRRAAAGGSRPRRSMTGSSRSTRGRAADPRRLPRHVSVRGNRRAPRAVPRRLVAVDVAGLSYAEAAELLDTKATITSRLFRARAQVARDEIVVGGRRNGRGLIMPNQRRHPAHRRGARARARGRDADLGRDGRRSRPQSLREAIERERERATTQARAPFWRRHRWGLAAAKRRGCTGGRRDRPPDGRYDRAVVHQRLRGRTTRPDRGRAAVARR